MSGVLFAILGAESTGKTTLARTLAHALCERGHDAVFVPEALRDFCEVRGRTPRVDEQRRIALDQTAHIQQALSRHAVVLADTSALQTAVYSEYVFGDRSLYEEAVPAHATARLTLLTALDLPWCADGIQRDGDHVREPVDALLRGALAQAGLPFAVVSGEGEARTAHALGAVCHALSQATRPRDGAARWRWQCPDCDDGDCERHWLTQALRRG
jgi:nicotinamide riboside kinase